MSSLSAYATELITYDHKEYPMSILESWGIGSHQTEYYTSDKKIDWYIDQYETGPYSPWNCGPAAMTMAMKWYTDGAYSYSTAETRDLMGHNRRLTSGRHMVSFLEKQNVHHYVMRNSHPEQIADLIKADNIIIVLNSMQAQFFTFAIDRTHRAHMLDWFLVGGHIFILKGLRVVDGENFVEIYDPNSWDKKHFDGTPVGKNRHYLLNEIFYSIRNKWNFLIAIPNPHTKDIPKNKAVFEKYRWNIVTNSNEWQ